MNKHREPQKSRWKRFKKMNKRRQNQFQHKSDALRTLRAN